jgi:large subunit ribosomal protein L10
MPTPEKITAVEALTDKVKRAKLAIVTDYRGMTVRELAALRRQLRQHHVDYTVAKNTLLRIAAQNAAVEVADTLLAGPTAVAFCYEDIVQPAKALQDFARTNRMLRVRGGVLDGRPVSAEDVTRLATLPPVDQLRAEVVGAVGGALSQFVGVLNGLLQTVVGTLEAQVGKQGGAAAAA